MRRPLLLLPLLALALAAAGPALAREPIRDDRDRIVGFVQQDRPGGTVRFLDHRGRLVGRSDPDPATGATVHRDRRGRVIARTPGPDRVLPPGW